MSLLNGSLAATSDQKPFFARCDLQARFPLTCPLLRASFSNKFSAERTGVQIACAPAASNPSTSIHSACFNSFAFFSSVLTLIPSVPSPRETIHWLA
jgi:hypothetical protein